MKILVIGDPHGDLSNLKKIPKKDINLILITGDLGKADLMRKMAFDNIKRQKQGLSLHEFSAKQRKKAFMEAYESSLKIVKYLAKFAPVYTIYGNVESSNKETKELSKDLGLSLPSLTNKLKKLKNVKVINNKLAIFKGIRIGGLQYFIDTNWVIDFKPKNYRERLIEAKYDTDKAKIILKRFGKVNILLCHQPPYGILDKVTAKFAPKYWRGKHAGSKTIRSYIEKKSPGYVFCGHIHEGEGMKKSGKTKIYNLGVGSYKVIQL